MGNTVATSCGCLCMDRRDEHFSDDAPTIPVYKDRLDAQIALHVACAGNSLEAVQEALAVGKACGVSQAELDDAAATVIRLRGKQNAGEALFSASQDQHPDSLGRDVELTDQDGLHSQELEKVERFDSGLEMEHGGSSQIEIREMLVLRLEKALNARDHGILLESIEDAEVAGLLTSKQDRALLARARIILHVRSARMQVAERRRKKCAPVDELSSEM